MSAIRRKNILPYNEALPCEEWKDILPQLPKRSVKPRQQGVTMILDRTLGLDESVQFTSYLSHYIDQIKLSFGTPALVSRPLLEQKIASFRNAQVDVLPGGSLFELSYQAGTLPAFFKKIKQLGFNMVEVSDGFFDIPASDRLDAQKRALDLDLKVISEVGKKDPQLQPDPEQLAAQAQADLENGVEFVVIEARESGRGVGIFDQQGEVNTPLFEKLTSQIDRPEKLIWEAPQKKQQTLLINHFGPNVNLGNVAPSDLLGLEALRMGLRWDTYKSC